MHNIIRAALLTACALVALNGSPAIAADRPIELGTSLTTAAIGVGDNSGGVVGVPTSSFGLVGPGVFATFFPSARIGIEPQLGLIYVRQRGESVHFVSLAGQVDYSFAASNSAHRMCSAAPASPTSQRRRRHQSQ